MSGHKSEKKGSNIICRVSNVTPEMVCRYVSRLPKHVMREDTFRDVMGKGWFQNEHQAPEQWGLYYVDGNNYYPRFDRDISMDEADAYLYNWMEKFIVINPYTRFKTTNDNKLVESIVHQLEKNPQEHDFKAIYHNIIGSDEPFVVNEIIINALNNYSRVLNIQIIDKEEEKYEVSLVPNYKEIINSKKYMTKKEYFDLFSDINISRHENEPRQMIYYGAPGTGKSFEIKNKTKDDAVIRTTFHPDSDYSTFVGCYKPTMGMGKVYGPQGPIKDPSDTKKDLEESKIVYEFVMQAFLKAYLGAWKKISDKEGDTSEAQFLVIEEINRGNCAQIFGDLFQLLDRNEKHFSEYPIDADSDLQKVIAESFKEGGAYELKNNINIDGAVKGYTSNYGKTLSEDVQSGRVLLLPPNLYIWATMNTSDQSLFPIDSAFKRRWDWHYLPIEDAGKGWKIKVNGNEYDWYAFLEAINKEVLALTHSEDKQLGYFFAKAKNGIIDAETLVNKVYFYLWTDVFKDYDIESQKAFRKVNGNEAIAFKDFFTGQGVNEAMAEQVLVNLEIAGLS